MINNACIFKPPYKFDVDLLDECSSVTVSLDNLKISNVLTYCTDNFLFIESVWPGIILDVG